jgi:hypothetical protein
MLVSSALSAFFDQQVGEHFLLRRAERIASERTPSQQREIRGLYDAAKTRMLAASELADPARVSAAGALYREATLLLVRAIRATREGTIGDMDSEAAYAWLRAEIENGKIALAPSALEELKELLVGADLLVLDRMNPEEAHRAYSALERLTNSLRRLIEPRTATQIKYTRWLRLALLALAGLGILAGCVFLIFQAENLAEGKPVRASSQFPGTPGAQGITNGKVEHTFGVHTQIQDKPWVELDLLNLTSVTKVKVYNRGDGWFDENLPLTLEVSTDGAHFTEVARRIQPFRNDKPWIWKSKGTPARQIRVSLPRHGYIALAEIEVFGK